MAKADDLDDSLKRDRFIDAQCDAFEREWKNGIRPSIELACQSLPELVRIPLAMALIGIDVDYRCLNGERPTSLEYSQRFPDLAPEAIAAILDRTIQGPSPLLPGNAKRVKLPTTRENSNESKTLDRAESTFRTTQRIHYFGDYELLELRARGGMGTVYRARQISLNRIVGVKTVNSGQFASPSEVARFYQEAKAAASLNHANIVPVYEVGECEGKHFFSMAYMEGPSLAERLIEGPLDPRYAAELLRSVAMAVQFAHERGIIHRDLKPSNILLDTDGTPKVTDFGLAKIMDASVGLTMSGDVIGTPSYMPPEQAAGHIDGVSYLSDVYSLGAVLYCCLAGRPPFQAATNVTTLKQVLENDAVPLRQVNTAISKDLETIVHKCLEKSASRRYASPRMLADDLGRFLAGSPIRARPISLAERTLRWCRRHPSPTLNVAAIFILILASLLGWNWVRAREHRAQRVSLAKDLIHQLEVASSETLPSIVDTIQLSRQSESLLTPLLQQAYQDTNDPNFRYRLALVCLPEKNVVAFRELCHGWLKADWREFIWIRERLERHRPDVKDWLLGLGDVEIVSMDEAMLSRLAIIASEFPELSSTEQRIGSILRKQVEEGSILSVLIDETQRDPVQLKAAAQACVGLRDTLGGQIAKRLDYRIAFRPPESPTLARLLGQLLETDFNTLFELGSGIHAEYFPVVFGQGLSPSSSERLQRIVATAVEQHVEWEVRQTQRRRRALAGTILLANGHDPWHLFEFDPDPSIRSFLIHWLPMMDRDGQQLIRKIQELVEQRPTVRSQLLAKPDSRTTIPNPWLRNPESARLRALIQSMGNYPKEKLNRTIEVRLWQQLRELFLTDPDPGIRSSCEWLLLRHQGAWLAEAVKQPLAQPADSAWVVGPNQHYLVTIEGPLEFEAGAQDDDPNRDGGEEVNPITQQVERWNQDTRHAKNIPRSFAISMHETRYGQMQRFDPTFHEKQNHALGGTLDHTACKVSWNAAAAYCNWLSEQADIPSNQWCFIVDPTGNTPPRLADDYLHREGYRLPTEAEWEYACRANTFTRRYFGDSNELLGEYAWYIANSEEASLSLPGTLKPNDLGLFDTLGNVYEWCVDPFTNLQPKSRQQQRDKELPIDSLSDHILKGAGLFSMAKDVRASEYANFRPSYREGNIGFRVARTLKQW